MKHKINHSKMYHRFTALRERLIIFAQSTIFAQPRKGPFNNPPTGQHRKTDDIITSLNNLQYPVAHRGTPVNQLAGVPTVRPDQRQPRKQTSQFFQNQHRPVTILDIGRVNHHGQYQTQRIYHQMAFSTGYLLAGVIPSLPPFSAVFTDWLSIIAAEGLACRPAPTRTCSRRWL